MSRKLTKAGTLRSCTIPTFTFYGPAGRRARIIAYTARAGEGGERDAFCVMTLAAHYHPSTAFNSLAGVCHYNGPDAQAALRVAQEYTGVDETPDGFDRFLSVAR